MNKLRKMSVFAHIVEADSISGAADLLGVSKSVVSQHLKSLEQELGVTLLKRTTRKQTLTSIGHQFYHHCTALNTLVDNAWLEAQNSLTVPSGRVRITAPNALTDTLIVPVISQLLKDYPKLEPELVSSDQHMDFFEHDIDLAIRVGSSKDSNLKQRRIGSFTDVLCTAVKVTKQTPLEEMAYIANAWQGKHISHEFKSDSTADVLYTKEAKCIANSFQSCFALIKSGVGIGLIPDFFLETLTKPLIPVFPQHYLPRNNVYALTPFNRQIPLSVQVCIEAIGQQFSFFSCKK